MYSLPQSYNQTSKCKRCISSNAYSAEADNLGYAVYIHDIEPLAFADSLGIDQGTSASLTDEDGNENTYSLFNNDEVKSPMAIRTFDLWSYGQSAYIPSVRQLSYLFVSIR